MQTHWQGHGHGQQPTGDPTFSLPSPFSDEARLSGSGMIKTESSNPFYYWKHNIYSLFHTYFSGSKEIFPLCLTSCGHDRCLKLEVPLSEETHTWNSEYMRCHIIFSRNWLVKTPTFLPIVKLDHCTAPAPIPLQSLHSALSITPCSQQLTCRVLCFPHHKKLTLL